MDNLIYRTPSKRGGEDAHTISLDDEVLRSSQQLTSGLNSYYIPSTNMVCPNLLDEAYFVFAPDTVKKNFFQILVTKGFNGTLVQCPASVERENMNLLISTMARSTIRKRLRELFFSDINYEIQYSADTVMLLDAKNTPWKCDLEYVPASCIFVAKALNFPILKKVKKEYPSFFKKIAEIPNYRQYKKNLNTEFVTLKYF